MPPPRTQARLIFNWNRSRRQYCYLVVNLPRSRCSPEAVDQGPRVNPLRTILLRVRGPCYYSLGGCSFTERSVFIFLILV